jgi:hypothetical protein
MKTIYLLIFTFLFAGVNVFTQVTNKKHVTSYNYDENFSEQDEQEILKHLSPELKNELLKVKEVDQEGYKELLYECSSGSYVYEGYMGYMESFEKERYETENKVNELEVITESLRIRYEHAKNDNDKQKIINELKPNLNQLFDAKENLRSLEVEMLEKELAQLKESLKVRKQNKNEIINRRLNELIGKGDYLDW